MTTLTPCYEFYTGGNCVSHTDAKGRVFRRRQREPLAQASHNKGTRKQRHLTTWDENVLGICTTQQLANFLDS